jgi:hypothetical protein
MTILAPRGLARVTVNDLPDACAVCRASQSLPPQVVTQKAGQGLCGVCLGPAARQPTVGRLRLSQLPRRGPDVERHDVVDGLPFTETAFDTGDREFTNLAMAADHGISRTGWTA